MLSEPEAKDWLDRYGVRTPARRVVADAGAAVRAFDELRPPVAVKLVSGAIHKSDIGAVRLGIDRVEDVARAIAEIGDAARKAHVPVEGFLIEEMAPPGVEILVGGIVDPAFGPAIIAGLGGVYAEVLDDVVARICPITMDDALQMIRELKAAALLLGARGRPAADIEALARVLVALGGRNGLLVEHATRIREIDLNPVIVSRDGAVAVDARVILQSEQHDG